MISSFIKSLVVALIFVMAGCAAPARIDQMTAAPKSEVVRSIGNSPFKASVAIKEVTGGQKTNPMWKSNVDGKDFEKALEASLKAAGLLTENNETGTYHLIAGLEKMDQPFMGFSMTVTAHVRYELVDSKTGKSIFIKEVSTPFTAKMSDALLGVERLKIANEGAARANINQFIDEISGFNLAKISIKD